MFQFIPVHEGNIYALRVSGKITQEDYQAFLPRLEELIAEEEKISLLIELDDFHGAELAALKDDLRFGTQNNDSFEKIAIVGDKQWHHWMTLLSTPFITGKVKYFNRTALQDAWDWLRIKVYTDNELAEMPLKNYQKVMACVDYSPHSKHAVKRAIKVANDANAELMLVNVVDEAALYDLYYDPINVGFAVTPYAQEGLGETANLIDDLVANAQKQMDALLAELGLDKSQGRVMPGRPKSTLDSYAKAQDVDLIVLGTHGRRGFDNLIGSSTRYIQEHAKCEVLSVPLTTS